MYNYNIPIQYGFKKGIIKYYGVFVIVEKKKRKELIN